MSRLGIKQPSQKDVTGTIVMMYDDEDGSQNQADSIFLKRSENGLILHPQPQDNPNDPLNWPKWKRDLCLLIIGTQTFLGGGQTPILAAGFSGLSTEFNTPLTTLSYLVGGFMLALGFGSVLASPTALLYGKRLVYLAGILLFLVGAIWAGAAKSFGSLMGARVIMGLGASPTESLPSATIAEIYFAHERAYRVGIYTMLLLGGKNIVPLLSGLVFQYLDRHWLFWILSMFLGCTLISTFFFVPETFWERSPIPNKRSLEETDAARQVEKEHPHEHRPNEWARSREPSTMNVLQHNVDTNSLSSSETHEPSDTNVVGFTEGEQTEIPTIHDTTKKSFRSELALFSGRHTIDSWWMIALRPFFLYLYPSVIFGSIVYSLSVVWLIVISETISEIFRGDGYGYSQSTVGLFYVSPFVGGVCGSMFTGLVSDRISRYMISKNHGVYEPEFRLVMLVVSTFFISFGLMGFGWSSQQTDLWIGPIVFFGCVGFGSSMASTTAITFTVDSYKMFAAEALVSFNFSKNLLGFIFSLFNNAFMSSRGPRTTFVVYGCVQIFVSLFAVPMYIYGKKFRSWTDEKEILKRLYKDT
ncbi:protein Hol1p [[Candida] anglica]|uniref:Protein Hol1p n=1 Tax=[Candida] anglica TaxID=148631 RepID=A0ABP0EIH6_9ASCO